MSVVAEAELARDFGLRRNGVTAMHDATEGGVLGGLSELAAASGVGVRIELDAIPVRPEVRTICEHVGIDPYVSISEGTLIATVVPERADELVSALASRGIESAVVGEVTPPDAGAVLVDGPDERPLEHPQRDPFWDAFGAWSADPARA